MSIQVNDLKKKLSESHDELLAEFDVLAKRAEALGEPHDDKSFQAVNALAKEISALEKRADAAWVAEKAPYRALCDEVDAFFRPGAHKRYALKTAVQDRVIEYLRNKQREARQKDAVMIL